MRGQPKPAREMPGILKWLTLPDVAATIAVAVSSPTPGNAHQSAHRPPTSRANADSPARYRPRGTPNRRISTSKRMFGRIISGIGDFPASRREICSTPGVPRLTPPARNLPTARAAR